MKTLPVLSACDTCAVKHSCSRPTIAVQAVSKKNWIDAQCNAELLVIPRYEHSGLSAHLQALDDALGGVLSKAIADNNFHGKLGERLVVPVTKDGFALKLVMFIGVGDRNAVQRYNLCAFYRAAIAETIEAGVKKVTLPVYPGQLSQTSLKGLLSILSCRVHYAPSAAGVSSSVEILCTPQAKPHVEQGVESFRQLCYRCSDPSLDTL